MRAISYIPSKDELHVRMGAKGKKPSKEIGRFKIWWDNEGNIRELDIRPYREELEEFRRNINAAHLGGIWRGLRISREEIQNNRETLLNRLEEKW